MSSIKADELEIDILNNMLIKSNLMSYYNLGLAKGLLVLYRYVKQAEDLDSANFIFTEMTKYSNEEFANYFRQLVEAENKENGKGDDLIEKREKVRAKLKAIKTK